MPDKSDSQRKRPSEVARPLEERPANCGVRLLALHYFRSSAWKGSALREIKETDWKVLRRLHPLAVERFCEGVLAEVERVMHNSTDGVHQRYLDIFKIMERRDREMARLFDGLKRSQGLMMLARIRSAGLLTEEEFSSLSLETRGAIQMLLDSD